ncbi:protein OBERON 3 [Impatiens glandulifera]|uniref:protein OBERON 3 n=1 Tax=Impatiens glandulifera TaxID=253017 RepID=UPI001FB08D00|nr:protein OBERON 3 [Impatiens glandulifera]
MLKENDLSTNGGGGGSGEGNSSASKPISIKQNPDNPDSNSRFHEKGIEFMRKTEICSDGFQSKPSKVMNSGFQELTLSYLCENNKLGFPDKEIPSKNMFNSLEKGSYKGKEVVVEDQYQEDSNNRWVERDFMQMNEVRGKASNRRGIEEDEDEIERENREKRQKLETLNLSLALPDVSLSLNADFPSRLRPIQNELSFAAAPSNNNTQTTYSNDFTAASLSYSYSHPFSHNLSCSLTRNSTENNEFSMGSSHHRRDCDQIWNAGEGTNGSVHSRFRPVGDGGVAFSNNHSFYPSELPARPKLETQSGDSRRQNPEIKPSRPERIVREIVSEPISMMSHIVQELTEETVESTKEYLTKLIETPERRMELLSLQNRLERRSDLTKENLSKASKTQLEVFVAIKMGIGSFLSSKVRIPIIELSEILLLERCRNVNCRRALPVEDCDCNICSAKKGFCSECMCPVCLKFDCASNTCSWVGCDVCSHWCHAACGIEKNLIKPGPSLKKKANGGITEVQFHCLGCGHASEMFGFVKDVFMSCAKEWGVEKLTKELDCVRKIFRSSQDYVGKELHLKADEMLSKLEARRVSPSDVCNFIFQFFTYTEGLADLPSSSSKEITTPIQADFRNPMLQKTSFYDNINSSSGRIDTLLSSKQIQIDSSSGPVILRSNTMADDEWSMKMVKDNGIDSLEGIVMIKEAETKMFQKRADDARKEAEDYRQMARMKSENVEVEYAEKVTKLCLQETEEKRRMKMEELKVLENAQCDYYKMKMRMQAEIAGLLERMEATKKQLV